MAFTGNRLGGTVPSKCFPTRQLLQLSFAAVAGQFAELAEARNIAHVCHCCHTDFAAVVNIRADSCYVLTHCWALGLVLGPWVDVDQTVRSTLLHNS